MNDAAAPAIDRRIDALQPARGDDDMAAPGAESDDPDLAVVLLAGAQEVHRAFHVAAHLIVADAAGGAGRCGLIVGLARLTCVEVRGDAGEAIMGELAGRLDDPVVPAGRMMDEHHAREGPVARRARVIGLATVAVGAFDLDGVRQHVAVISHAHSSLLRAQHASKEPACATAPSASSVDPPFNPARAR